jgi:hypothetical protein
MAVAEAWTEISVTLKGHSYYLKSFYQGNKEGCIEFDLGVVIYTRSLQGMGSQSRSPPAQLWVAPCFLRRRPLKGSRSAKNLRGSATAE